MKKIEVLNAWANILAGRAPSLSIEITKECPLRCPGFSVDDSASHSLRLVHRSQSKGFCDQGDHEAHRSRAHYSVAIRLVPLSHTQTIEWRSALSKS
jgi:hypothetical protein